MVIVRFALYFSQIKVLVLLFILLVLLFWFLAIRKFIVAIWAVSFLESIIVTLPIVEALSTVVISRVILLPSLTRTSLLVSIPSSLSLALIFSLSSLILPSVTASILETLINTTSSLIPSSSPSSTITNPWIIITFLLAVLITVNILFPFSFWLLFQLLRRGALLILTGLHWLSIAFIIFYWRSIRISGTVWIGFIWFFLLETYWTFSLTTSTTVFSFFCLILMNCRSYAGVRRVSWTSIFFVIFLLFFISKRCNWTILAWFLYRIKGKRGLFSFISHIQRSVKYRSCASFLNFMLLVVLCFVFIALFKNNFISKWTCVFENLVLEFLSLEKNYFVLQYNNFPF